METTLPYADGFKDYAGRPIPLYRADRHAEAVEKLNEAVKLHGAGGSVWMQLFLSMAHHRLGQKEESRAWLEKARKHIAEEKTTDWADRVRWQILCKEVEGMIDR